MWTTKFSPPILLFGNRFETHSHVDFFISLLVLLKKADMTALLARMLGRDDLESAWVGPDAVYDYWFSSCSKSLRLYVGFVTAA